MSLIRLFHYRHAYFIIGAFFLSYVTARSFLVGITYDEATTIRLSTEFSLIGSWGRLLLTANNHLINTLWIKFIYFIGFESLFVLRLSSVVSFIFYLYFSQRITSRISPEYIGLACFFLLSCNLFLLDFFGLARGYGMSIAFMMGALFFGLENTQEFSLDKSVKSLVLGSLSVVSIYSMIYFFGALFLGIQLIPLIKKDLNGFKKLISSSIVIGGALFFIIAPLIGLLIWRNQLYYGGGHGIYQDTILSLTKYSFYSLELTPVHTIGSIAFLSLLVLVSIYSIICRSDILLPRNFVLFVVFCIGSELVVFHNLLGMLYPINRVALFLYPIATLSLFLCLETLRKWVAVCISSVLICIFSIIFVLNANFYKSILWRFDSRTEEILTAVNRQGEETARVVTLGVDATLFSSMEYYIRNKNYPFVHIVPYDGTLVFPKVDYYAHISERSDLEEGLKGRMYQVKEVLSHYRKNIFLEYPEDAIVVFSELNEY